jgi:hypothetical protein
MSEEKNFYVYAFLRSRDSIVGPRLSPYYIGKGKMSRAFDLSRKGAKPPSDRSYIVFVQEGLTEAEALALEIFCIKLYGRVDNGSGILRNLTDGGEGVSGYRFSEEGRQRLSLAHVGIRHSEETRRKMSNSRKGQLNHNYGRKDMISNFKGKKHTEDARRKISLAKTGQKQSLETIEKRANSLTRYRYELIDKQGEVYVTDNLTDFALSHGLARSHLGAIAQGKRKTHKGWKCRIIEALK